MQDYLIRVSSVQDESGYTGKVVALCPAEWTYKQALEGSTDWEGKISQSNYDYIWTESSNNPDQSDPSWTILELYEPNETEQIYQDEELITIVNSWEIVPENNWFSKVGV